MAIGDQLNPEKMNDTEAVERAIYALQNLGIDLNDYDSEMLDIAVMYALAKLRDEQEPYRWPNP